MLEVRGLSRSFGGLRAVSEVCFDVAAGRIKGVIGPNGAGKTTLFNLISGSLRPDTGTVKLDGASIEGLPPHEVAARGLSRTFQNLKIFRNMTVLENVMVGCHVRSRGGMWAGMLCLPSTWTEERRVRERARELLAFVDIESLAHEDASRLSFGQQRAVELARALAPEPKILLLDEPAAGLNMRETAGVGELIGRIRDRGVTVLLVEHDMSLVMGMSDEIVVLSFGCKIAEGTPREVRCDPEVIRVYLGEDDAACQEP
jgi:branched-chain amino acid transport system ATP-binding protein